jgi:hypothetical protein
MRVNSYLQIGVNLYLDLEVRAPSQLAENSLWLQRRFYQLRSRRQGPIVPAYLLEEAESFCFSRAIFYAAPKSCIEKRYRHQGL